jgi:hypothetical protein
MLFDLMSYPGWLAAALAMGIVVGWRTYADVPRRSLLDGWFKWGALVFVIGVIVAVLKLFPGRFGLWLEIFLLMTAVYIIGCFLGGWLKNLLGAHATGAARAAKDRLAADAAAKAQAARKTGSANAEVVGVSAKVAKAETQRPTRMLSRRATPRLRPLPMPPPPRFVRGEPWRRIMQQRKLRKRSADEKLLRPLKPRRIGRLRRLSRRPRLSDKLPPRPRRIISLQRLPRGPKSNDRLILVASPRRLRRSTDGRTISG